MNFESKLSKSLILAIFIFTLGACSHFRPLDARKETTKTQEAKQLPTESAATVNEPAHADASKEEDRVPTKPSLTEVAAATEKEEALARKQALAQSRNNVATVEASAKSEHHENSHSEESHKKEAAAEHATKEEKHAKKDDAPHHKVSKSVEPQTAMRWLKNGNVRFQKGYLRKDGQSKADVGRLSKGQYPHTIVLSCSDSRVPPEIVFDQKLGEIFVVRTAGEAIDPSAIASIEYAVAHLGAKNILVMGHSQCGAIKAALATLGGKDAGSENLNHLVKDLHPRLKNFSATEHSADYGKEAWANAKGIASDLISRSNILNEKVKSGDLKISAALYHLDSGAVDFE